MESIIPQSVTDKINILFTYVRNLYNSFHDLTTKYFLVDNSNNIVTAQGKYFTINVTDKHINLGANPSEILIFYGTGDLDSLIYDYVPNGSLFLTQNNGGEGYIYTEYTNNQGNQSHRWQRIVTEVV